MIEGITENQLENAFRELQNRIIHFVRGDGGQHDKKFNCFIFIFPLTDRFYQLKLQGYKYFELHTVIVDRMCIYA